MRRGFSLYAPVVGVILLGVSLLILASFMNEENARIGYLRVLRASYAYLLPTQSMRYDAFTAFSVAARIYFQNEYIKPGEKPDVGKFLSDFLAGFTVPAGTEIKDVRFSWNSNDVDVQMETKEDYVLLKVRLKRSPGPTYSITLDAGGGREETIEVPIFEQKETTIYVPYPYGKLQQLAQEIQSTLKQDADAGNIAFGYCSKIFEAKGGVQNKYKFRNKIGTGSMKELGNEIANFLNTNIATNYNVRVDEVWFPNYRAQNEVNMIHYLNINKDVLECLLPYNWASILGKCKNFYAVVRETEKKCAYVTSIGVRGVIESGGEKHSFKLYIPLTNAPALSTNKTEKNAHYKQEVNINVPLSPYYCCKVRCTTNRTCGPECSSCKGDMNCIRACINSYKNCMNACKQECRTRVNQLKNRLNQYNISNTLEIFCPQGIHTAVLCDEHGKCHYRDRQGRKK